MFIWTRRTFESLNLCSITRNAPHSTLSVTSTPQNFSRIYTDPLGSATRPVVHQRGVEQVQCLITDGDPDTLVDDMMDIIRAMSDATYKYLKDAYGDVLEELVEAKTSSGRPITNMKRQNDSISFMLTVIDIFVQAGLVRSVKEQVSVVGSGGF